MGDASAPAGDASPLAVPPYLAEAWSVRDRSAELHRAAYTGLARQVPLPRPELYDALVSSMPHLRNSAR
ncbi:hypothetical protein [Streptomyces sp. C10]|uniref:hypothetical protein n=1 Tax=Streptomyces sp. C10 TaxID=531941 RepID=UPI0039811F65